ncbi:hypothetical protein L1887_14784 [Cichorium endivia]|nr:hypothetical protein L1887_14784 [Cichorium endivia]
MVQRVKEGTSDYVNEEKWSVMYKAWEEAFRVFPTAVEAETVEIRTSLVWRFSIGKADRQLMAMVFTSSMNNPSSVYGIRYKNKK